MASQQLENHSGRETRLVAIVIAISIAVLLLLARFRFPAATLADVSQSAGPLAGLAARAAFDEMALTMSNLLDRVSPAIVTLPLGPAEPAAPPEGRAAAREARGHAPQAAPDASGAVPTKFVAALRVRADVAVAYVPAGRRLLGSNGQLLSAPVTASTPDTAVVLVRPPASDASAPVTIAEGFSGLRYVGVVEATPSGPTVRPVFIGRVIAVEGSLWSRPLNGIGVQPDVPAGAWVFALDGRLIGLAVPHADGVAVVPGAALLAATTPREGREGSPP